MADLYIYVRRPLLEIHAGLMDRVYGRQRHIYDLTRKYYLFGRDRLIRELALEAARRGAGGSGLRHRTQSDRYRSALSRAPDCSAWMRPLPCWKRRKSQAQPGRACRSRYPSAWHGGGACPAAFGLRAFDHVVFSYSLSMIPDWRGSLEAALAGLAGDGGLACGGFWRSRGAGAARKTPAGRAGLGLFHVAPRTEFLGELGQVVGSSAQLTMLPGRYAFLFRRGKR